MSEKRSRARIWTIMLSMLVLTSTLLGVMPTVAAASYSPTWSVETPTGTGQAQTVTVVDSANDTVYIIGGGLGVTPGSSYNSTSNLVMAYSTTNGTSWRVASIPTGVRGASGGMGEDGRIYVFSGLNNTLGSIASTQIYDIATDSWSTGANIPISEWEAKCAVDWPNMYVIGGALAAGTDVQIYNARTNSWSAGVALPNGRFSGAATYVQSVDSIFYVGGVDMSWTPMDTVYQHKIGSGSWNAVANLPFPVAALDVTTGADGLIYAAGGSNNMLDVGNLGDPVYSAGYYYCVNNDTWYSLPDMNFARKYLSLVSVENMILAIGGNNDTMIFNYVESLAVIAANPTLSATSVGQGGSAWLNMTLDSYAAVKGTALVYYLKSDSGTMYPAMNQIFAAGNVSTLIEIPQTLPAGNYELHAYFGTSFETGTYSLPEAVFPLTVFATISIQQQIADLQNDIVQLQQLINEINGSLSSKLNDTMDNITKLQQRLADLNDSLAAFVTQLQTQMDKINASLTAQIDQLQSDLDQAKADLANEINLVNASLMSEISDLQAQNTLLQNQITQLRNDMDDLKDQMSTNDQALMDKLNQTNDEMNNGLGGLNNTITNDVGSLSTNMMIGLLGLLVAMLIAILVVFMSLSRKIKDLGLQQMAKGADENADPGATQPKMRTVKQKSPEQQIPPPPAPPEEKL